MSKLPSYMRDEAVTDRMESMTFGQKRDAYVTWEGQVVRGFYVEGFREWLYRRTADQMEREAQQSFIRHAMDVAECGVNLRIATPEQIRRMRGGA